MKQIFTLGASTIPGEFIIPRLLSLIIQQLPGLELKIETTDSQTVFEKVKSGELEMGIIGTKYEAPDVEFEALSKDDRLVLITPKDHPLTSKKALAANELKGLAFVGREQGSGTRAAYEMAFRDAGLSISDLNVVAELSDTEGIIQAVEGGAGVSIVSELAAREAIELGRVRVLDLPTLKLTRDFYVATRRRETLSDPAVQVLAVLRSVLK